MESTLKLNTTETVVLLSALNIITLKGSDAKIVANLQYKLEAVQQQNLKKEEAEEQKKEDSFAEMVKA